MAAKKEVGRVEWEIRCQDRDGNEIGRGRKSLAASWSAERVAKHVWPEKWRNNPDRPTRSLHLQGKPGCFVFTAQQLA